MLIKQEIIDKKKYGKVTKTENWKWKGKEILENEKKKENKEFIILIILKFKYQTDPGN